MSSELIPQQAHSKSAPQSDMPIEHSTCLPARPKSGQSVVRGFSLIEVLIAVAIFGILTALAAPSYKSYVEKTRRSDAHLSLLSAAQSMERCRSTQFSYQACPLPAHLQESEEGQYDITLTTTRSTFLLTATPKAAQAHDADCTTITLDDMAQQGFTGPGPCW